MTAMIEPRVFQYSNTTHNNLQQNARHQFAQRHALRIFQANAIYSFIPKNACSTLRLSVALANGCLASPADFNWIHNNNDTFRADLAALANAAYTFTVLRCPFRRLASVYLDKIVGKDPVAWVFADLCRREIEMDDLSFDAFVGELRKPYIKNGNIHWRPQVDFLVYRHYDDYFSVEDFPVAVATLRQKIGLPVIDARPLTKHGTDHLKPVTNESFSSAKPLDIYDLKRQGFCPTPESLYNDRLVSLVREVYADDIALYRELFGESALLFT